MGLGQPFLTPSRTKRLLTTLRAISSVQFCKSTCPRSPRRRSPHRSLQASLARSPADPRPRQAWQLHRRVKVVRPNRATLQGRGAAVRCGDAAGCCGQTSSTSCAGTLQPSENINVLRKLAVHYISGLVQSCSQITHDPPLTLKKGIHEARSRLTLGNWNRYDAAPAKPKPGLTTPAGGLRHRPDGGAGASSTQRWP